MGAMQPWRFHFVDSDIDQPTIEGSTMKIRIRNLGIPRDHPFNLTGEMKWLPHALFIFSGVTESIRIIHEYEGEPSLGKFHPARLVSDGPFPQKKAGSLLLHFEGRYTTPLAWIEDWQICCDFWELEIESSDQRNG